MLDTKNNEPNTLTGEDDDGTTWTYKGEVHNGIRHGKGKWSNGEVYEVDCVDDKPIGKGEKTYTDDSAGEMGFIYCPNCGQSVSKQAKLSACPKCYHPFDAKEWQKIKAQKDALAAEEKRKRDAQAAEKMRKRAEEEQRFNYAKDHNECPLCHRPISWER